MKAIQQFENAFGIRITRKKHLEILALLICLEIVLALSYLGYIQIAPISVTTLHIFVIVAGMLFGPMDAAIIASVFAVTSMWKASVTSIEIGDIIFSPLLSGKPLESVIMAAGTRIAFGVFAGFAFRHFFSKERKHTYAGTAVITVIATLLHSALVYVCMDVFFGAGDTATTEEFNQTLILNNVLLLTITVCVVHFCYKLGYNESIRTFLRLTAREEREASAVRSKTGLILFTVLFAFCVFISLHFMSRLGWFIRKHGENVSGDYLNWTNSLMIQFIVGFAGVFGILSIFVRWVQEFYAALTIEANVNAKESAESANKSKTAFLFNMSHDIRTPMNAILGFTDIALNHADEPDKVRDSLGKIKQSGDHLLNLINDILEMSRIESGNLVLAENPVDIRELNDGILTMSRALAIPKDIDLRAEIGDIRNPYVYADELHLNEVIINLISNAVKYTHEGGKVRYAVSQLDDAPDGKAVFRFEVSDNGIGMSEEFQKHLFEAFSREEKSETSKTEGAGLGLSIVKRIVDQAGGAIYVNSRQNEGSTFTVEAPFRVLEQEAEETFREKKSEKTLRTQESNLKGKTVLLVEDNEMNREIATEILTEAGLSVETAADGAIAVRTIAEKGAGFYDFILMDIQMPVMDGYTATKVIRKLPDGEKVPIIALSANAFKEDVEKSIEAGMNAHVAKPIDIAELLEAMKSAVK